MRIIAGSARSRKIEAPEGKNTRPTLDRVRENLFNILQTRIRQSVVLDLFSGSGALAFEAVSRGAESAVLVDRDRRAHEIQRRNAETLHFTESCEILLADWAFAVQRFTREERSFDLVFLDPPYIMCDLRDVMKALVPIIHKESLVIVEHEGKTEPLVPDTYQRIDYRVWGFCGVSFYSLNEVKVEETT